MLKNGIKRSYRGTRLAYEKSAQILNNLLGLRHANSHGMNKNDPIKIGNLDMKYKLLAPNSGAML